MDKIKATVVSGNSVTDLDDWQKQANPWTITLHYQGREMTFPFWTGFGWDRVPNTEDALSCIIGDARSGDPNYIRDFEEFCSDFAYNPDSRKAEKVYQACVKTWAQLVVLLGDDYDNFLNLPEEELHSYCEE